MSKAFATALFYVSPLAAAALGAGTFVADLGGCPLFPADSVWNTPVDTLPVHPDSAAFVQTIGPTIGLHPDFGTFWKGAPIGIPYVIVPWDQPLVPIAFYYGSQSDPGPYPIPPDAPIEGGAESDGDRHILIVQTGADGLPCTLWEIFDAHPVWDAERRTIVSWWAGSGATWDLSSHALRPDGWTSADAAGLPILPGLVRFDEAMSGEIAHALRFTCVKTRSDHDWPARHDASDSSNPARPAMGQRFRLKEGVDIDGFAPPLRTILQAMKTYGIILADNGSNWYVTGTHDVRWDDDLLGDISQIKGSDFEAVDISSLMVDFDSGQAETSARLPGDLDQDGDIDGADLGALLAGWGVGAGTADLDVDGDVDGADLGTLLAGWTG